ncbi:MAG TPA: HIT family protein [bacterium]|nr:HIT family protein [bacterium]
MPVKSFDPNCIFCRIVAGEVPASVVYRGDDVMAFMDIRPVNPGHLLVISTAHAAGLANLPERVGQRMWVVAQRLAAAQRLSGVRCEGVNLFVADGEAAGQDVFHVHIHVLPRFPGDGLRLTGLAYDQRPAPPSRAELDETAGAIRRGLESP